MKINKVVQSLAKNFTTNPQIRPNLAWVFFTKNKAVATNSFKLCEIEFLEEEITQEDLNLKNFDYKKYNESVMINKDDFKNIKIPKNNNLPIVENLYIWNIKDWNVEIRGYDLEKYIDIKTTEMKWKFPDYEWFFKNEWTLEIWFWVDEMIELLQVYKKAWVNWVKMQLWTPLQPLIFLNNDSSQYELNKNWIKQIKSILMPLKI